MKQKGFTVVELLIVIIIIAILGVIALPQFMNAQDRGKQNQSLANLRNVANAISIYATDNNGYPDAADMDGLAIALETGDYMKVVPKRDGWGNPFQYILNTDNTSYVMGSCGKGDGTCAIDLQVPASIPNETTAFSAAILIRDGTFIQYPFGAQGGI